MAKNVTDQIGSFVGFALGTTTVLTIVIILNPDLRNKAEKQIVKILDTNEIIMETIKICLDAFINKKHQENGYEAQPSSQWDMVYHTMQEQ